MPKRVPERLRPAAMAAFTQIAVHGIGPKVGVEGGDIGGVGFAKGVMTMAVAAKEHPEIIDELIGLCPEYGMAGHAAHDILHTAVMVIDEHHDMLERDAKEMANESIDTPDWQLPHEDDSVN